MILTGDMAREARQSLAFSQAFVSQSVGIGRSFLSQFENNRLKLERVAVDKLRSFYEEKGYEFDDLVEDPVAEMDANVASAEQASSALKAKESDTVSVSSFDLSDLAGSVADIARYMREGVSDAGDYVVIKGHVVSRKLWSEKKDQVLSVIDDLEADQEIFEKLLSADGEGKFARSIINRPERIYESLMMSLFAKMMALKGLCVFGDCSVLSGLAEKTKGGDIMSQVFDKTTDRVLELKSHM